MELSDASITRSFTFGCKSIKEQGEYAVFILERDDFKERKRRDEFLSGRSPEPLPADRSLFFGSLEMMGPISINGGSEIPRFGEDDDETSGKEHFFWKLAAQKRRAQ